MSTYPTFGDVDLDRSPFANETTDDRPYEAHDVVVGCDNTDHPLRFATITDPSTELSCSTCGRRMWRSAYLLTMPHSEVCMHMRIAGDSMWGVESASGIMVQLYDKLGKPFSFPITKGEAGWPW